MMKIISLNDIEDGCGIAVEIDPDYSGVLLSCANIFGHKTAIAVDSRLLKQFCIDVSKAIHYTAQQANECGEIVYETIEE